MRQDTATDPDLADIEKALDAGQRDRAINLAIAAFGRDVEHPLVLRLVATGLEEDGRVEDAAGVLHRVTELSPEDPTALTDLGAILIKLERFADALDLAKKALSIAPDDYGALILAGKASLRLNEVQAGLEYYNRAAEIAPNNPEALSAIGVIASRRGDAENARHYAELALALRPDFVSARMAVAQADIYDKAPKSSENRLRPVLARPDLNDDQRSEALVMLADALDAQGRAKDAFAAYSAANAILLKKHATTFSDSMRESRIDNARRLADYFETAREEDWRQAAGDDIEGDRTTAGHVFLLGFPRSGTTLLEQVLASHPRVVALEERAMLLEATGDLLESTAGLDRLSKLSPAEADAMRRVYWEGVRSEFNADVSAKVFVDKMPLSTVFLPVIAKLFPTAKIIFARRDPRDVVLSCFRRRFRINEAMFVFLTLEGAAHYYDQVMRAAEVFRRKLKLDIYTLRHEALVADFDAEAERLLNYIGVDWDPNVRNFAARARVTASTPSAAQLAKGLSAEGVGQWRRYEQSMRPVLGILEPWAARFDYPAGPSVTESRPDPRLAALLKRAKAAAATANWSMAFQVADEATALSITDSYFDRLLAMKAQQQGRLREAISHFEAVLDEHPADFAVLSALGLCLARMGRGLEALARLDDAIAFQPDFAPSHYNRGWTLERLSDLVGARDAYLRAVRLDPRNAQALGNLAALAARAAAWPEVRDFATRALALNPGQAVASTALATAEAATGDGASAERRLRGVIDGGQRSEHERAVALGALGDVLDNQGRPADAFAAYESAGAALHTLYAGSAAAGAGESAPAAAERLTRYFASADRSDWRRDAGDVDSSGVAGHVFLLGFPRSGTTMLGQALASGAGVVTLDERETLAEPFQQFLLHAAGLNKLAAITAGDVAEQQDRYWRRVRAFGVDPTEKIFIDKLPMNALSLPLISKLFPRAKVLLMRRDPRDVVLSTFRRQFAIDSTTVEFLSLPNAARFYDSVMRLTETYLARLDLDLRLQGFETLIGDFAGETRAICDFIDATWDPAMMTFSDRAGAVATPSSSQIARGLNAEGIGRWRDYRAQMAPVLPILKPWVDDFGYPAD